MMLFEELEGVSNHLINNSERLTDRRLHLTLESHFQKIERNRELEISKWIGTVQF